MKYLKVKKVKTSKATVLDVVAIGYLDAIKAAERRG
jgi:hypothetical protein